MKLLCPLFLFLSHELKGRDSNKLKTFDIYHFNNFSFFTQPFVTNVPIYITNG